MPRLSDIAIRMAAKESGVSQCRLLGRERGQEVFWPRYAAIYALRNTGWTLPEIGRAFRRHHTSIILGLRRFEKDASSYHRLMAHDIMVDLQASIDGKLDETTPADLTDTLVAA